MERSLNLIFVCVLLVFGILVVHSKPSSDHFCITLDGSGTCHSTDVNPYRYYGTKTAYSAATSNRSTNFEYGECVPKLFYLFSRHATRYPKKDDIDDMNKLLPALKEKIIKSAADGRARICDMDIESLNTWNLTLIPEDDNKLSYSGKNEAINLARRYKKRFPTILDKNYSPDDFVIEYTSRVRTRTTAESFSKGLFGEKGYSKIDFEGKVNDEVLQFHKDCSKLLKSCGVYRAKIEETKIFLNGPEMKKVQKSVSKRLGFSITYDDVKIMYKACAFGYALQTSDIWCSIFSADELKVFEYSSDIEDYYRDGYGNELNYKQACVPVKYITNLLRSSLNQENTKAVLHFSHAGAIKKVISRFGLFKGGSPLSASGLCAQRDRNWRSSFICPFTSNLAFVLFQCGDKHKVTVFHDENPVIVDGCDSTLCPIEDFFAKYDPVSQECDFNKLCCPCCGK